MPNRYAELIVPQSQPLTETQVQNSAGGYVYKMSTYGTLDRFLITGTESGTYYTDARQSTALAVQCVKDCLREDYVRTIDRIVEVSQQGLAPSNDPCIVALAIAAADTRANTRKYALTRLGLVCRIPTHLFLFVQLCKQLKCRGRIWKRAVSNWYVTKTPEQFLFHTFKYQNRSGMTNRDILRMTRIRMPSQEHLSVLKWINTGAVDPSYPDLFSQVTASQFIHNHQDASVVPMLIEKNRLTHEMLPSEVLKRMDTWGALLPRMGLTAVIRSLARMTAIGLLTETSPAVDFICERLTRTESLQKARIHPIQVLLAMKVYESGGASSKGSLRWTPVRAILAALEEAFYKSFKSVEPTGKILLIALDVSGSMSYMDAKLNMTARELVAALSMIFARTEENVILTAFSHELIRFVLNHNTSLPEYVESISHLPFGRTDCALPMLYATAQELAVDAFIIYTDNETWYGEMHPSVALEQYRERSGINAKMIVNAVTATSFSIADPHDANSLDIAGFSSDTPQVVSWFLQQRASPQQ